METEESSSEFEDEESDGSDDAQVAHMALVIPMDGYQLHAGNGNAPDPPLECNSDGLNINVDSDYCPQIEDITEIVDKEDGGFNIGSELTKDQ